MDVRDAGVALWRQWLLVVTILLVTAAAVAGGLYLAPKTYTATATVSAARTPEATQSPGDLDALRATLAELASSRSVVEEVRGRISSDRDVDELRASIRGRWVRGTILVEVTADDRDPFRAAEIANAVATVLADRDQIDGVPEDTFVLTISDRAMPPTTFSSPDLRLSIGLGVLLALGLAASGAVLRDRRTHTVDDAACAEAAASAPLLAHLLPPRDVTAMPALVPGTADADAFRHLRVALESEPANHGAVRVVIAGVTPGDLNVWVGANTAIALAGAGRRVLLVDGRLGERFGRPVEAAPDTPGLNDVLRGAELATAVSPGPVDLLRVLPAGTWGDEPPQRLLEDRFPAVMAQIAGEFDLVLVLGPPLEVCDDATLMAIGGSLVVVVVEGAVSITALRTHADRVRAAGARMRGVVLVGRRTERVAT